MGSLARGWQATGLLLALPCSLLIVGLAAWDALPSVVEVGDDIVDFGQGPADVPLLVEVLNLWIGQNQSVLSVLSVCLLVCWLRVFLHGVPPRVRCERGWHDMVYYREDSGAFVPPRRSTLVSQTE